MNQSAKILAFVALMLPTAVKAQEAMNIHRTDGVTLTTDIAQTDSLSLSSDGLFLEVHRGNVVGKVAIADIESIDFGQAVKKVSIVYTSTGPRVVNPYAFGGLDIQIGAGGSVVATGVMTDEVTYELSGTGTGSFKLYSAARQQLVMDGLNLTSTLGPAINVQSKKKTTVVLSAGTTNRLADTANYDTSVSEDQKGAFFSEGQLVFNGDGQLEVEGNYKHALCSDDYIRVEGAHLRVTKAVSDGIHSKDYFRMVDGSVEVSGTAGDCIDGDQGTIDIEGGTLTLTAATADTKALKCDSTLTVAGGTLDVTLQGDQTKGLKAGGLMLITGGKLTFNCTGGVVVTDGNPSYCTAIKGDSLVNISGGEIIITHTGSAGKGISADGDMLLAGGTITATLSGDGNTYTNASNQSDTYASTAIKADGALFIQDGVLTLNNSGKGGKCINVDGKLTIGDADHCPTIEANTTGAAVGGSSSTNPWSPGGGRPGGGPGGQPGGSSSTGGKPKAVKAEGDLIIDNGDIAVSTKADGGEGLESKQTITINGGTVVANAYDDGINAATLITINGGKVYSYSSGNDGIDSNGRITITGGVIVSSGTNTPEEGFDCDNNTFTVTGGTLVGFGGSTSTPTSSVCTQCVAVWQGTAPTSGTRYTVTDAAGKPVVSFTAPRAYSQATILFSAPGLAKSNTYTIYTGGTLTGGSDDFYGCVTDATGYTPGTQSKQFTPTSMVTSIR